MSALGTKYECIQCAAKFYDLGRRQAICPSCGTDQADGSKAEEEPEAASAPEDEAGPESSGETDEDLEDELDDEDLEEAGLEGEDLEDELDEEDEDEDDDY